MTVRERTEQNEFLTLAPYAVFAARSVGRARPEEECELRTCFQRDVDRVTHCPAFRRLKHKTQVFLSPEGDHYRTRLTHTLEVQRISRTIARALALNEDLTEAIALGHDLGHTPFGHAGENALREVVPGGFEHNEQSVRVVEKLERNGDGLNLTREVVDGILCHTGPKQSDTAEGRVVHLADRIAYINHDIDDAIRAGILTEEEIPSHLREVLGKTYSDRIDTMVKDVVATSDGPQIAMSPAVGSATDELREFLFAHVYRNPMAKGEEGKARSMLLHLYSYLTSNPAKLPIEQQHFVERDGIERAVCDYIASMTDHFAVDYYEQLFIPKGWTIR